MARGQRERGTRAEARRARRRERSQMQHLLLSRDVLLILLLRTRSGSARCPTAVVVLRSCLVLGSTRS